MVRINKRADGPEVLLTLGIVHRDLLIKAYNDNPLTYTSQAGVKNKEIISLKFDRDIYAATIVKDNLIEDQHEKCCFCEAKFLDTSYGDVEHFRPKAAYMKSGDRRLTYPGYYWLAYDWSNLLFSCEKCNRSYKKNQFPLNNENTRKPYYEHANDILNEDRLLIDPTIENPNEFFEFKGEDPVPIAENIKGKTSIRAFNLKRLNSTRLAYLKTLKASLTFAQIDKYDENEIQMAIMALNITRIELVELIDEGVKLFNSAAKNTEKFAYCVRCNFPNLPI